ncbi:NAD(P)-dependent oxidoreductase [Limibacillus halophilus]
MTFIGLGKMGLPMARRLQEAGFSPVGCDLSGEALAAFREAGGRASADLAEAADGAEIVITMLPDGAAVRSVLVGEGGVVGRMAPGGLVIDMSSSEPQGTRELESALADLGLSLLDAPVSGGVKKAVDGSLAIMAGGSPETLERARPLLEAMGSKIFLAGPIGAGHAMKALNNYVSSAGLAALCEALVIAREFGIEPGDAVDILNASTGRNNSTENKAKPYILSGSFDSGFALSLMSKDIGIAEGLSRSLGLSAPLLSVSKKLWASAAEELGPRADHTEYFRVAESREED